MKNKIFFLGASMTKTTAITLDVLCWTFFLFALVFFFGCGESLPAATVIPCADEMTIEYSY